MKTKISYLILIILCFYACEKKPEYNIINYDFRDDYIGDYEFVIHQIIGNIKQGNTLDSTYIRNGFVDKYGKIRDSLLQISYGTDTFLRVNENGIEKVLAENSALKLSSDNSLSYPGGIGGYGHTFVNGKFINADSLVLYVSAGGNGFWNARDIAASKINNP